MFRVRPRARGEMRARSRRAAGYARVGRAAEARLRARVSRPGEMSTRVTVCLRAASVNEYGPARAIRVPQSVLAVPMAEACMYTWRTDLCPRRCLGS